MALLMQGSGTEKDLANLFMGHCSIHIQPVDMDAKSEIREPFMGLDLEVSGCTDLYQSLDKFCEVEMLDGENKYYAEGHGWVVSLRLP